MVSGLLIAHAVWWYFTVWLAEHLVAGLFGIAFPLHPFPLYILVVGDSYSLACLQSSRLIIFASCFFIAYFNGFHYYYCYYDFTLVYFDWLPLNLFQCDWCPYWCCLILFCLSLCGVGAHHWVVDIAGHWGWFHPAGVGLLANCRVVLGT